MRTDKLTKVLLGIIAIALWIVALNPWLRPESVVAREEMSVSFRCRGDLDANAWGGIKETLGGYSIDLRCD